MINNLIMQKRSANQNGSRFNSTVLLQNQVEGKNQEERSRRWRHSWVGRFENDENDKSERKRRMGHEVLNPKRGIVFHKQQNRNDGSLSSTTTTPWIQHHSGAVCFIAVRKGRHICYSLPASDERILWYFLRCIKAHQSCCWRLNPNRKGSWEISLHESKSIAGYIIAATRRSENSRLQENYCHVIRTSTLSKV